MTERSYTVYKHTFPNGKVYIGITSQKPEARWGKNGAGYCKMKNGRYKQSKMAAAILKHGWDNIKHEVVHEGLTKEEAEQIECSLIAKYQSNHRDYGYNIENGGHTKKVSDETKRKLRELNLGEKSPKYGMSLSEEMKRHLSEINMGKYIGEKSARAKKVVQYDMEGKTIKVWGSLSDIKRELGLDGSCVSKCCRGKRNHVGNYVWRYYEAS